MDPLVVSSNSYVWLALLGIVLIWELLEFLVEFIPILRITILAITGAVLACFFG